MPMWRFRGNDSRDDLKARQVLGRGCAVEVRCLQ